MNSLDAARDRPLSTVEEAAVLGTFAHYTTGIFSQGDVSSALDDMDLPPSSGRIIRAAASQLDQVRDGKVQLEQWSDQILPSTHSQESRETLDGLRGAMERSRAAATVSGLLRGTLSTPSGNSSASNSSAQPSRNLHADPTLSYSPSPPSTPSTPSTPLLSQASPSNRASATPDIRLPATDRTPPCAQPQAAHKRARSPSMSPSLSPLSSPSTSPSTLSAKNQPLPSGPSSSNTSWPTSIELVGGPAQYYRGPLSAAEVRALLDKELSENARVALTGFHSGYLRCYHFIGLFKPVNEKRKGKKPEGGRIMEELERWRCRACHRDLHTPQGQVSNLGTHLFGVKDRDGTVSRVGCLDIRAADPIEAFEPPLRDSSNALVREGANKRYPKPRSSRSKASMSKGL
ncbi:hypothetical protein A4X13_0g6113 [Tilletia indica]|uniref:Uncharacterized protein n=1 Tax=Tilletia indica TaxID=43049 RepID=A0A177T9U9_9BASI|nr:hypothetical protein A4X13_0g6113 [Tilletia indica]